MPSNDPRQVTSTYLLDAIDRGDFQSAIDHVCAERESDSLDDILLRAECALYLDRLDEADDHLGQLRDDARRLLHASGEIGQVARRARLVEAGLEYARGRFDETLVIAD